MAKQIVDPELRVSLANVHFETTRRFMDVFCKDLEPNEDLSSIKMHIDDVIYNMTVLKDFIDSGSLYELENGCMAQDTLVRDYYYSCVQWIGAVQEELFESKWATE